MKAQSSRKKNKFFIVIESVDTLLSKFEGFMLAIGVIAMAINTIAAVISRFVFNDALTITDELNMIFIVIVTFAGLSFAARNARHIRMSALFDALPHNLKKILMILIASVTSVFMFFLSYYSILYIYDIYLSGRILPALSIPVFYIYLWVPIGFFVTALQYVFTIIKNFETQKIYLSTKVEEGYNENINEI